MNFMDALPTAAELDRAAYRLHAIAFPLWTFTIVAGAIWAEQAWGHYWSWDPKEVWSFVIWVVYAGYLHARATRGWGAAQGGVPRLRRVRLPAVQLPGRQHLDRRPALLRRRQLRLHGPAPSGSPSRAGAPGPPRCSR